MTLQLGRHRLRHGNRELELPLTNVVFGRAMDCHVRLECGLASRHHARMYENEGGLFIEDLGSRNGVMVNGRRIEGPTLLAHGDVITIGLQTFEVEDQHMLKHPANLSTLPPASAPFAFPDAGDSQLETLVVRPDVLSAREREVLELVVLGYTQKEMAERLHVSVKTVETHRAHIAEKLACRTRAEMVSYAISAGLLRTNLSTAGEYLTQKSG